ncbi:MAG: dual specificity protein phosphatase family protein [Phycisphaerae bacterium]|nr:dual specificity protein phosphatase family protein [Phycisphaerae bacterium]
MTSAAETKLRSGVLDPHQWRLWLAGLVGSRYDGLCHFHVVEPGVLMRCGQPRVRELEQIRAEQGLNTIVCARGGTRHPLRGRWFRKERAYCARAGIHLEHMPFSDAAAPPPDVFDRFLTLVQQPERRPVLVHCEQGFHRSGILCAAYRIRVGGWPIERAVEEMRAHGFDSERAKRQPLLDALIAWARP